MKKNLRQFLKIELYTAYKYAQNTFEITTKSQIYVDNPSIKKIALQFLLEIENTILIVAKFKTYQQVASQPFKSKHFKEYINISFNIFNNLLQLPITPKYIKAIKELIQSYYDIGYYFHNAIHSSSQQEILLPKSILMLPTNNEDLIDDLKDFVPRYVMNQDFFSLIDDKVSFLDTALEHKRQLCFKNFIEEGNTQIAKKEYKEALESFEKARNYHETAELLNLIGWAYSFLDDLMNAKKFSLMAIQKDKDYGPAYNDLGSYLHKDGDYKEALKWYELAKHALNYTNKEYPYINSGKVYLSLHNLELAIHEFSIALTISPLNHELQQTLTKLKHIKDRSEGKNNLTFKDQFNINDNNNEHNDKLDFPIF